MRRLARLYWFACAFLFLGGLAGAFLMVVSPPEVTDEAGNLIAEMPLAFGAALMLATVGLAGAALGLLVVVLRGLLRRR